MRLSLTVFYCDSKTMAIAEPRLGKPEQIDSCSTMIIALCLSFKETALDPLLGSPYLPSLPGVGRV